MHRQPTPASVVVLVAALLGAGTACSEAEAVASVSDASAAVLDGSAREQLDARVGDAAAAPDASTAAERSELALPGGMAGIGFDDLQYSASLDRLIVPAGRAGYVGLVDPVSQAIVQLGGFSSSEVYAGGHGFGTTSAIEAEGLIYAIDRTALELRQLDPSTGATLDSASLGGAPDYVRFVAPTRELWVTEPSMERFEIFALGEGDPPALTPAGEMAMPGGPESMVVSADGATAYTNTFIGETMRVDTGARSETTRWSNGCAVSLGLAIDESAQRIFVGCAEGKASAIDTSDGAVLSMVDASGGVDVIAYSSHLGHLYLNGSTLGELTVAEVDAGGTLAALTTLPTAPSTGSSCVASDAHGNIWVCDAAAGQLLRIPDVY